MPLFSPQQDHYRLRFMETTWPMFRYFGSLGSLTFLAVSLCAQSEPGTFASHLTFDASVQGSHNDLGTVTRLDTAAGYQFNRHWSFDLGVPFYFIAPSSSVTASAGGTAGNTEGLGNVYSQVRFAMPNPVVNYVATLTGTAPTGDRDKGLSTGHATVDLSNYFDHALGRLTPFAEIGFANAVSDTQFFIRPYTTSGFVTHVQAGARYRITRWASVGAAGYDIEPAGQQTVVSRVVTVKKGSNNLPAAVGNLPLPALTNLLGKPTFETTTVTTGSSSIARDRGYSGWVLFGGSRPLNLQLGYTHSTSFNLDTLFFGVGVHIRKPLGTV